MARVELRTLVVARKMLSHEQYQDLEQSYSAAKLSMMKRAAQVAAVGENLQRDMKLLCVTVADCGEAESGYAEECRYLCVDADRGQAGDLQVQHDLVAYSGHPCAQGSE